MPVLRKLQYNPLGEVDERFKSYAWKAYEG
jgi:hypothetical protein